MDKNSYSPTWPAHSMSDTNHNQNLSSSTCPASPPVNSHLDHIVANMPAQNLPVNSDTLVSTLGIPSTMHVISPMSYNYGCESSTESSDSDCIVISVQNVKPSVNAIKRSITKKIFTEFKKPYLSSS